MTQPERLDEGAGTRRLPLIDRHGERQSLHDLLERSRAGMGGALVLRGEPGIGKSTLLDEAVETAADMQVLRVVAAELEMAFGYAAVHQLLLPLLPAVDRLPAPQRQALGVAFGTVGGPPADPFLIALAVLTLLGDAAETRPVLCVVDDAQWLDDDSATVLTFVARRLLADPVAILFAVRERDDRDGGLEGLPQLQVAGLTDLGAHALLEAAVSERLDRRVREQLIAGTSGNPLALLEVARELTPEQLAGRAPLPAPLPVGRRLEELFVRRVRGLPEDTRTLLLLAAADQPGAHVKLWPAAAELGIPESAALPAEAAGMADFWPQVRFHHPLVRSAVYYSATPAERRHAHRALAANCDHDLEVDERTWHLAAAAAGPDEEVAAQMEASAARMRSRGGYSTMARLLERAALLTPDPVHRAERQVRAAEAELLTGAVDRAGALVAEAAPRLRDPLSQGHAVRLEGLVQFADGHGLESATTLLRAAGGLQQLDPSAARDCLLTAVETMLSSGWTERRPLLDEIARTVQGLPPIGDTDPSAADVLLQAYADRITVGYAAAVPAFRRAIGLFLAEDLDVDVALRRLMLAIVAAADMADVAAVDALAARWIQLARDTGALTVLPQALAYRGALADVPRGRLAAAVAAAAESREIAEATNVPRVMDSLTNVGLLAVVMSGREAEARSAAAGMERKATATGDTGRWAFARYCLGILELSLGNHEAAVARLERIPDGFPVIGAAALPELVEAAVRAGRRDIAEDALKRFTERSLASGTSLSLGLLARSEALLAEHQNARMKYEEALELLSPPSAALELARTHLAYGEWLRRQRQRREARAHLRTAHEMFDAMGAAIFSERARGELRATGERARRRDVGMPEELTSQEARIAQLVSRGYANRDIAAELFLSEHTVAYHLRKVFRKLGVTSRTQLAHLIMGDDAPLPQSVPALRALPGTG
jgi:DNA-binding CsgD family transcriptional regulator